MDQLSGAQAELLPVRLLRAAQGNRPHEAAVLLLCEAGVLNQLGCCIVLDVDRNLAWVDWPAVSAVAGRVATDVRVILLLASAIATEGQHLQPSDHQAVRLALEHLTAPQR